MSKLPLAQLNLVPWLLLLNGILALSYIGLIAVIMSYATLQVELAHSVRSDGGVVAEFESAYLKEMAHITTIDYHTEGYARPEQLVFVPGSTASALSVR
jgi:hypothetical protein